jgi:hypothetical protein
MSTPKIDPALKRFATPRQAEIIDAVNEHGSNRAAAAILGLSCGTVGEAVTAVKRKAAEEARTKAAVHMPPVPARTRSGVLRFILTAAQDETPVDAEFFHNLIAYADDIGAELKVAGFTYQKGVFTDHSTRTGLFASIVQPYLIHENEWCGPLLFAAKFNILPTAVRPLSGLETHSRGRWAVFPHAKIQLVSVPSLPGRHPAMVMTTAAVTLPNYIDCKKAGLKAEFHHQIGATIVEVDEADRVFCRQIGAGADGGFQDLDAVVRNGRVTRGHRVESITAGDLHIEKGDPLVFLKAFGYDLVDQEVVTSDSLVHDLRPRTIAWHDVLDFQARNHHRRQDPHFAYEMLVTGRDSVEAGVIASARFLAAMNEELDDCEQVVAASNHHDALTRWLREADPVRHDPLNARYWCELQTAVYRAIERGERHFDPFRYAVAQHEPDAVARVTFVPRNGSRVICEDHGGIEIGMHGDEGPNGSRGSALALTKVATRMNIGHAHTASILDGVYTAGLSGLMDQQYNSGPSGWSHTHIVTYPNARRTLITMVDGKWRA